MQFDGRASKVMVVDHDRTNLEMLQIRLDVAGFHPIAVRYGRDALEMLGNARPDAVILERNLPDIDGMELLRAMAALPGRPAPVLLVGRNIAAEDVRAGIELGVRDCLAKPFSGTVVLERLTRMLKRTAPGASAPARPAVYINA